MCGFPWFDGAWFSQFPVGRELSKKLSQKNIRKKETKFCDVPSWPRVKAQNYVLFLIILKTLPPKERPIRTSSIFISFVDYAIIPSANFVTAGFSRSSQKSCLDPSAFIRAWNIWNGGPKELWVVWLDWPKIKLFLHCVRVPLRPVSADDPFCYWLFRKMLGLMQLSTYIWFNN